MPSKHKDNSLMGEAYRLISEATKSNKCPDCGCNPLSPKAGCKCKHKAKKVDEDIEAEDADTLEEKENKKPEWLLKSQKKAEGDNSDEESGDEDSDKEVKEEQLEESKVRKSYRALEQLYEGIIYKQ